MALPQPSVYQDQYYRSGNLHMALNGPSGDIRYTTDGSDPTLSSTLYTAPIPITWTLGPTLTYRVAVFDAGDQSPVVTWTVSFFVGEVSIGSYISGSSVKTYDDVLQAVSCESPGAVIRYTDDGSIPTELSMLVPGNVLFYPWTSGSVTITFRAFVGSTSGYQSSITYVFGIGSVVCDTPSSVVYGPTPVSLSCPTPNTNIRYTLDGSLPNPTSALYSAPLSVGPGTVLRAVARIGNGSSPMTSCVYDYEHKSHNSSLALGASGNIVCVYEKTQNQKPGWPLAVAEQITSGSIQIQSYAPLTSSADPTYMFWTNPTVFNQSQPQSFSNLSSTFVVSYDDTFSALSMFGCSGNIDFSIGALWNTAFASLIENADVAGRSQDSRFVVKAVSSSGLARLWIRNVSGTNTLFLTVSDFNSNILRQSSVVLPATNSYCFLHLGISASGISGGVAFNTSGNLPTTFVSTSVLAFDANNVGFEIENESSTTVSGTCELVLTGFSVVSDSGKFMREPAGITTSAYTLRSCGSFSRFWDMTSIDHGCFDMSVSRSGSVIQSDRYRGGFVMGFAADEYLSLSTHQFGSDFDVEIPVHMAYGGRRNDGSYPHVFRITGSEAASSCSISYVFNSGSASKIEMWINGSSIGSVGIDYFNPPQNIVFKFVRSGSNLTLSVSLNSGALISFSGSAPPDAGSGMAFMFITNACESGAKTPATICIKSIAATCSNLHMYGVDRTVTLHGWYGMLDTACYGFGSQELTFPASSTGLVVYSKSTRTLSLVGIDSGWNQETDLVVGMYRTHASGLYEYVPVINSSLVCSRQVSWAGVLGQEHVVGVGSNPKITDKGIAWESGGDVVFSTPTSPAVFPYSSYRGYSNSVTKPPRRLRSHIHVPVKIAFYTEIPQ